MVRTVLAALLLAGQLAHAEEEPPIAEVGVRLAAGAAVVGWRDSSWGLGIAAEYAFHAEPWTSVYGELMLDGIGEPTIGASLGLTVHPTGMLRASAGGLAFFGPARVYGGRASLGACARTAPLRLCLDLEGNVYVDRARMPDDRVAADVRLVFGVAFPLL